MKAYQYKILRYIPDRLTGEFVNIGLLLQDIESGKTYFKMVPNLKRIKYLDPNISSFVQKQIKAFAEYAKLLLNDPATISFDKTLDSVANSLIPSNDNSLYFSESFPGVSLDSDQVFDELFKRLVMKNEFSPKQEGSNDTDVWKKYYKEHFQKHNLIKYFLKRSFDTTSDTFEFDHCWENEVWHIYQPIALDLTDEGNIKAKIYRINGSSYELATSNEQLHITYLATDNRIGANQKLKTFVENKLTLAVENLSSRVVFQADAEKVALELKEKIREHEEATKQR